MNELEWLRPVGVMSTECTQSREAYQLE
jgi:hypothetical protein